MDLELTEVVRASVQNQDIDFYDHPEQILKKLRQSPHQNYIV